MTETRLQFERVKRYLERIKEQGASAQSHDDLLAFFNNCWSLKDHIKNDSATPVAVKNSIETDVKNYESLMIAADLANRSKHLKLDNKRRDAQITGKNIQAYDGTSDQPTTARYIVTLDGGCIRDALDIAVQAGVDWEALLTQHGL